jgi:Flp pilus assembly protein TadD
MTGTVGPGGVAALTAHALRLALDNRLAEAEALLREAHALAPADPAVLVNLGEVLRLRGALGPAWAAVERAWALAPLDPAVRALAAAVLRALGRTEEAVTMYRKALGLAPGDPAIAANLADLLRTTGRAQDALPLLRALVARGDAPVAVRNSLLMALHDTGDVAAAVAVGRDLLMDKHRHALDGFARTWTGPRVDPAGRNPDGVDVLAFPLFGTAARYLDGAVANVALARTLYPGWRCRFYCDGTVPAGVRERLAADGAEVVMVPDAWRALHGAFWRLFVADDRTVRRFLSRDCDCRLNGQERWAVDAWVRSGRLFHAMRDHPYHAELILAGMWGGHAGVLPPVADLLAAFPQRGTDRWSDQAFAAAAVWPLIHGSALIHDGVWAPLFGARPFAPEVRLPRPDHVGRSVL